MEIEGYNPEHEVLMRIYIQIFPYDYIPNREFTNGGFVIHGFNADFDGDPFVPRRNQETEDDEEEIIEYIDWYDYSYKYPNTRNQLCKHKHTHFNDDQLKILAKEFIWL